MTSLWITDQTKLFFRSWQFWRPLILLASQLARRPIGQTSRLTEKGDKQWDWKTVLPHPHRFPHHFFGIAMSLPSSSPEREASRGSLPQLECPSSPSGMDPDPPSTGSPVLSPDSSSHDAVLSAPAASPADSENLSPDELELLAKLEEQNRYPPCG